MTLETERQHNMQKTWSVSSSILWKEMIAELPFITQLQRPHDSWVMNFLLDVPSLICCSFRVDKNCGSGKFDFWPLMSTKSLKFAYFKEQKIETSEKF